MDSTNQDATQQPTTSSDAASVAFANAYKNTSFYAGMNEDNKSVMDTWANKSEKDAIKQMYTDKDDGHTLSYSEMRSRYG